MENKSTYAYIAIVAIVAIVAMVVLLSGGSKTKTIGSNDLAGNAFAVRGDTFGNIGEPVGAPPKCGDNNGASYGSCDGSKQRCEYFTGYGYACTSVEE